MLQKTRPLLTTSLRECYRIARKMFDKATDLNERTSYLILISLVPMWLSCLFIIIYIFRDFNAIFL